MTHDLFTALQHRASEGAFAPTTMIDTLFHYPSYYGEDFQIGAKPDSFKGKRFAVVGAGASGLMAAYMLANSGAQVDIFEASDRLGGRMCSVQYKEGTDKHAVFELGCMRFPPSSTTLFSVFDHFGIETKKNFPDPGTGTTFAQLYYQNELINWSPPKDPDGHSLPDSELFQRLGRDFGKMLNFLLGDPNNPAADESKLYFHWDAYQNHSGPKQAVIECWQKLVTQYQDVSFGQAVYTLGQNKDIVSKDDKGEPIYWSLDDMNAFGALGIGSGGFGPLFNIGFLEMLRVLVNGFEDRQELVLAGISTLTEKIVAALKKMDVNIYRNSPVTVVPATYDNQKESDESEGLEGVLGYGSGPVTVGPHYSRIPAWDHTYEVTQKRPGHPLPVKQWYNGVIFATTSRALQMTGITTVWNTDTYGSPHLSPNQKSAVQTLHLTSSSKFFVRVKKKFWLGKTPKGGSYPSNIQSDQLFRGLYCLDYDPKNPVDSDGGVVLISYTWEDDSTKLLGLTKKQRYEKFLEALTAANPEFAAALRENTVSFSDGDAHEDYDLSKTNMIDWQSQPYYYGAFKLDQPGQEQFCHDVVYQFQDRKPFAICGDSISWVGGWMEGALTSAVNAACAVAKATGCELKPDGPLENVTAGMYDYSRKEEVKIF